MRWPRYSWKRRLQWARRSVLPPYTRTRARTLRGIKPATQISVGRGQRRHVVALRPSVANNWPPYYQPRANPYRGSAARRQVNLGQVEWNSPYNYDALSRPYNRKTLRSQGLKRRESSSSQLSQTYRRRSTRSRPSIPFHNYRPGAMSPPTTWKPDYAPPIFLHRVQRPLSYKVREVKDANMKGRDNIKLHSLLSFASPRAYRIRYDVRQSPYDANISLVSLGRLATDIDLCQFATSPPAVELYLHHPRLPWYIPISANAPFNVTVGDVLVQMYQNLMRPVNEREYHHATITDLAREEATKAYYRRRGENGLIRMDFLGANVMFLGLVRGRNGLWEMKMTGVEL